MEKIMDFSRYWVCLTNLTTSLPLAAGLYLYLTFYLHAGDNSSHPVQLDWSHHIPSCSEEGRKASTRGRGRLQHSLPQLATSRKTMEGQSQETHFW